MVRRLTFALALAFLASPVWAQNPSSLEADELTYDQDGSAQAEGNVTLHWDGMTLQGDRLTLVQHPERLVTLSVQEGQWARLWRGSELLELQGAEYWLDRPFLDARNLKGKTPAGLGTAYFSALHGQAAEPDEAVRRSWIPAKRADHLKKENWVYHLEDLSLTTCPMDPPVYRVTAKKMILVPGHFTVARHPSFYLWGHKLFTLPFDLLISQEAQGDAYRSPILPRLVYDGSKGLGVFAEGSRYWEAGRLTLGAAYWSKQKLEVWADLYHRLSPTTTLTGRVERLSDSFSGAPLWRGRLEGHYRRGGWQADLRWAWRELVTTARRPDGTKREVSLWRQPELSVVTPWWGVLLGDQSLYVQLNGSLGWYAESSSRVAPDDFAPRYAFGARFFADRDFSCGAGANLRLFVDATWKRAFYPTHNRHQDLFDWTVGGLYRAKNWHLGLAFEQKRVDGRSPWQWDRESKSRDLYPRLGFALGEHWFVDGQLRYNLDRGNFTWAEVKFTYDDRCCTRWNFYYRHSLRGEPSDRRFGLSFEITAFPESALHYGSLDLQSFGTRPAGLPKLGRGERIVK